MVISPESFISSKSSGCILMYCTTHGLRYRTQFTVFFKLISISAVHQPSSLLYVGSTAVGAAKRHLNRMAVHRRLKKTEFVDAELSLRYWASHDNLFQFALVPLRSYENYQLAWVAEHELIAQWQTPLNFPRAMALIKKTALGFRISSKKRVRENHLLTGCSVLSVCCPRQDTQYSFLSAKCINASDHVRSSADADAVQFRQKVVCGGRRRNFPSSRLR